MMLADQGDQAAIMNITLGLGQRPARLQRLQHIVEFGQCEIIVRGQHPLAQGVEGFGLGEGALFRMVRSAYHLLGLRTYFTTGEKETRAWTFYAGSSAPECAGRIHSDFQRGFIKAEVIHWDELLEIGGWNKAKEVGKIRIEGKEYHPLDGDVMEFRFNV
eukprot:gene18285-biopygen11277